MKEIRGGLGKRSVLVLGASGLLGATLTMHLRQVGYVVFRAGRSAGMDYVLDPADVGALGDVLRELRPDCVINLVAATNVDACETDVPMAMRANALVPAAISSALTATASEAHFIHVSTDQVYDGSGRHTEDRVSPVNVYGLTKLTGELLIKAPETAILRSNFFGRSLCPNRQSFSDWIVRSLCNSDSITLFDDVHFSALHIGSLCQWIELAMARRLIGTYNLGCRNGLSKAAFALALAEELQLQTRTVTIGRLADCSLKARRPLDMTMQVCKIESALGANCPDIYEEVRKTAKEYKNA